MLKQQPIKIKTIYVLDSIDHGNRLHFTYHNRYGSGVRVHDPSFSRGLKKAPIQVQILYGAKSRQEAD